MAIVTGAVLVLIVSGALVAQAGPAGELNAVPKGNIIICNVSVGGKWLDIRNQFARSVLEIRDNLVDRDPGFVDPENADFQLKDGSPVYDLGFKRIPMEHIGLYQDEQR